MKTRVLAGAAVAALALAAAPASASSIGHFAPAGTPGGVLDGYVGSGISNDNMVLSSGSGISLGLKSHDRFAGDWGPASMSGGFGVYDVLPGLGPDTTGSGATRWSYLWAIDFGSAAPGDYGVRVKLDFDPTAGPVADEDWYILEYTGLFADTSIGDSQSMGFNWYDPAGFPAGFVDGAVGPSSFGFSEFISVDQSANYADIDVFAAGEYRVMVEVYEIDGDVVTSAGMIVNVVPLPPAAFAGLAGLAGVAVMRRRFRSS